MDADTGTDPSADPIVDAVRVVVPDADVAAGPGLVTATVVRDRWVEAVLALRDRPETACDWPDFLAASDEVPRRPGDADGYAVIVRLWSVEQRHGVALRTLVPRDDATLPTLTAVWPGLAWHEREAHDLHGITFAGHPDLRPLLTPDAPGGWHPLRKDTPLVARQVLDWPGAADPAGARGRPPRPYGADA
ncbi:MAG TPA: NADH-quinone oxidoreductase subunit C [Mycobacteriales bacterium]|nr:NADH-quinone oxidoreductase subunit C [Mycobacteriales bacterium]